MACHCIPAWHVGGQWERAKASQGPEVVWDKAQVIAQTLEVYRPDWEVEIDIINILGGNDRGGRDGGMYVFDYSPLQLFPSATVP